MGGPMRMNPPRGMAMGPQVQIRKMEDFFSLFRLIQMRFEFSRIFFMSLFLELRRHEASSQLHGGSHARNEHVSPVKYSLIQRYLSQPVVALLLL